MTSLFEKTDEIQFEFYIKEGYVVSIHTETKFASQHLVLTPNTNVIKICSAVSKMKHVGRHTQPPTHLMKRTYNSIILLCSWIVLFNYWIKTLVITLIQISDTV
jgi:hypothetical protein